jgi:hypothetical protein
VEVMFAPVVAEIHTGESGSTSDLKPSAFPSPLETQLFDAATSVIFS